MKFLKEFGIGVIFAICLPLLLVLIALVAVYGVLDFIVEFVIMLINFFSGRKCFPVFEEDEEAYRRKQEALNIAREKENPQPAPQPNNIYVQQVYYNTSPMGQPGMPFPKQNMQGIPQPDGFPGGQIPQPNGSYQANQIPEPRVQPIPFSADQIPGMNATMWEAPIPEQIPVQQAGQLPETPIEQKEDAHD